MGYPETATGFVVKDPKQYGTTYLAREEQPLIREQMAIIPQGGVQAQDIRRR
jgi:hypothetical protein